MRKEQKDKILKALAEDRNDYARDCQRHNTVTARQSTTKDRAERRE